MRPTQHLTPGAAITGPDRRSALEAAAAASAVMAAPLDHARRDSGEHAGFDAPTKKNEGKKAMTAGGFSRERIDRMHDVLAGHVEGGRMPGLVALASRRGETHVEAIGSMAFGNSPPMRRDTIFRIASVTKPITAAGAMILVEECKLRLDDPVDPWLPELADRKVLRSIDSPLDATVPANRPITLRDLLTFRAGYGAIMVWPPEYPIQNAMVDAGIAPSATLPTMTPDALMKAYGSLPLVHQPGEKWLYNSGADILGVLIARAAGKTLGTFLREHIFEPLGMNDTGFSVPPEKIDRLPTAFQTDFANGGTSVFDEAEGGRFASPPVFESGAGGLVTTADDYLAFCRMMLNKGTYDGGRHPVATFGRTDDRQSPDARADGRSELHLDRRNGLRLGLRHGSGHPPRWCRRHARTIRLERRLRHHRLHRPARKADRHPADAAPDGVTCAATGLPGLLDVGVPGHRRLSGWRGRSRPAPRLPT